MNFFKGLNKEQWTALGAAALSALLLLFGFGGGGAAGASAPKGGSEEPYNAQKPRTAELPDEKFERYWGRNPFRIDHAFVGERGAQHARIAVGIVPNGS